MYLCWSITLLSNNRVAVCGGDFNLTRMVKCYHIRTGTELDCAELRSDPCIGLIDLAIDRGGAGTAGNAPSSG